MLREFFESLKLHAGQTLPVLTKHPGDPAGMCRTFDAEAKRWMPVLPFPPYRLPQALCVRSLLGWTLLNAGDDPCEVWYSRDGIYGIPDPDRPHNRIILELDYTDQFQKLTELAVQKSCFDQKGFVRLLAIDLNDCVGNGFIQQIRRVCWRHASEATGTVTPSKASVGRKIEQELERGDELPETIDVNLKVWTNHFATETVSCAVEINLDTQKFQLTPLAGEIENALRRAEEQLCGDIGRQLAELAEITYKDAVYQSYFGNPCLAA